MYMCAPCLNFQNRYFVYYKVGHVLVNIEPIFKSFVTISSCPVSRPCVVCQNFIVTWPQYASMLWLLLYSKGKIFEHERRTLRRTDMLQPFLPNSDPLYLSFILGQPGNLCFFVEIICSAPWISQVQSTRLPSIFPKAEPCLESEVILFNTPELHVTLSWSLKKLMSN